MLAGVCLLGFGIASKHVMAVLAVRVLAPRGRAQEPVLMRTLAVLHIHGSTV